MTDFALQADLSTMVKGCEQLHQLADGADLCGCVSVKVIVVGDELHCGVPDVLGRELPSTLDERNHDICVPLQVWEKPAKQESWASAWNAHKVQVQLYDDISRMTEAQNTLCHFYTAVKQAFLVALAAYRLMSVESQL